MALPLVLGAAGDEPATQEQVVPTDRDAQIVDIYRPAPVRDYLPLTVAGQSVAATYTKEKLGQSYGAIIVFPDQGEGIDSYGVIHAIKSQLPLYGWDILCFEPDYPFKPNIFLAVQDASVASAAVNVSEAQASPKSQDDTKPEKPGKSPSDTQNKRNKSSNIKVLPPVSNQARIQAAVAFLQGQHIQRIAFLGHGKGGEIAIQALDKLKTPVQALILVGTGPLTVEMNNLFTTFDMPVLDLAGSRDTEQVMQALRDRQAEMRRYQHARYEQDVLTGADHFFAGVPLQDWLVRRIRGWLHKHFVNKGES